MKIEKETLKNRQTPVFIPIGEQQLSIERPVVMGILNVTADSFYDGGKYLSEEAIITRIHTIVEEGAAIIDVGGYSTRPGALPVEEKEELGRLMFAVELIRKYYPTMPVSIDTFRSRIVREVYDCMGPVIVNDISGGTLDPEMFSTVAELNIPYILMHIQGTPQTMQQQPEYKDVVGEVKAFLLERIRQLNELGFDNIILDQGFGFGKDMQHNYELMSRTEEFTALGYPLLTGISRKTMIWKLLGITPAEALNGTTVLNTVALMKGANILRVHDVKEAAELVKIVDRLQLFN